MVHTAHCITGDPAASRTGAEQEHAKVGHKASGRLLVLLPWQAGFPGTVQQHGAGTIKIHVLIKVVLSTVYRN